MDSQAPRAPRVVIVDGAIAVGKTALIHSLAAALTSAGQRVCVILEPVDEWNSSGILVKFYQDPDRWAYTFQTLAAVTRLKAIRDAVANAPCADVYLLERSPATDAIFMAIQTVEPIEREMYQAWCNMWTHLNPLSFSDAVVLYLNTSLSCCMHRLARRNRAGEIKSTETGGVSTEYQIRLRRAHEAYFQGKHAGEFPNLPKCVFSRIVEVGPEMADGNFRDAGPERDSIVSAILKKVDAALAPR